MNTALQQAYRGGYLQPKYWAQNIIAGIVVGLVALPLAMAFAIASGAKPEQGIYTAIIAGAVAAIAGGSRLQITGPTGAFIVILAGITSKYGYDGLQLATLMAGILLVIMGVTKLGKLVKFIPDPVIVGFTAGIGVIIWVGQWHYFFGVAKPEGEHLHEKLLVLFQEIPHFDPTTTLLSLFCLAIVVFWPRLPVVKRVPGPLVALVVATALVAVFRFPTVATIGSAFGGIPTGLPSPTIPQITPGRLIELAGPAVTIALLGSIESLLSAVVADSMAGARSDTNQELVGQGLANIASPLLGGFAATGAIARTATNIKNGGNSPISGIVHSLVLLLIIVALAPLAVNVPLAALAAILFVVAWNMSDARHFVSMIRRAPRADVAILLVTFLLTVFADLVVAVNVGVILATLNFLRRMSTSVEVHELSQAQIERELLEDESVRVPPGVLVYHIDGPFFFAAVETFERVLERADADPKVLVVRMTDMPFTDMTGLQTLQEAVRHLESRGVRVILCEANPRVYAKLRRAGLLDDVGPDGYADTFGAAVRRAAAIADGRPIPVEPGPGPGPDSGSDARVDHAGTLAAAT
ncbi:MAG: SulP family inorganic anion transporter [Thermomicrobiales bacterium]